MQMKTSWKWRAGAVLFVAGSMAACTVDRQEAPGLAGPSTFGQSVTLSASPDRIAHNGSAQSVITLTMRDDAGQPLTGKRVSVGASAGTSSHVDVVTGADGRATFIVTAPPLATPAEGITVFATPFGTDANNANTFSLAIALTGTQNSTAPSPVVTSAPDAPVVGQAVAFDASGTTDEGQACNNNCSYSWNFGDGSVASGIAVTHTYAVAGTYFVGLTVVDNAGTIAGARHTVTIAP
jgi:PKD repeat protein